MTNQERGLLIEADGHGRTRTRWSAYLHGLIGCVVASVISLVGLVLATSLPAGPTRYAAATAATFVMLLPLGYSIIRMIVSQQRRSGRLIDALTRQLTEAAASADRPGGAFVEASAVTGLGRFELDLTTDTISTSDEAARMFGLPSGISIELALCMEMVHPDERSALGGALDLCRTAHEAVDVEHRLRRADGAFCWVHTRATWTPGEDEIGTDGAGRVAGTMLDISERKEAQEALDYRVAHDTLTGLANRDLFLSRIEQAVPSGGSKGASVAVLFLDLDDFKTVNDGLGHAAGDELLVTAARRIASVARPGDTVARLGGDEFALLLESGEMPQVAEELAKRIADALRPPFYVADTEVTVRASIGIAVGDASADSSDLLRDADLAMYMAKGKGKNRFETARPGMRDEALNRVAIVTDLRRALEDEKLDVFYQPIVDAHNSRPVGAEALLRWHHPRRGLIPPIEFMAVAEAAGLIVPLGEWVLNQACRQAKSWRQAGIVDDTFYISVNISARQLAEPSLIDSVSRALDDSGLSPGGLVLEITETTLGLHLVVGLARLQALRDLGVRLALDNQGTGFSSLTRLGKLPIDLVKIDKTLIDHVAESPEGRALVQSVIEVTQALGIDSIAQGVEQPQQRAALEDMGCRCLQGHLFAAPMLPEGTASTLQRLAALTASAA